MTPPFTGADPDLSLDEHVTATRRAFVHTHDRQRLLEEACRVAVEVGGFRTAWIGWRDATGTIVPAARAGHMDEALEDARASARTAGEGWPHQRAVQHGRPVICQDVQDEPAAAPWRELALAAGYSSCGAFPLRDHEAVVGVLVVYAEAPGRLDDRATALLGDLADDLAVTVLLREEQDARLTVERRFRQLVEHAAEGIFRTDVDGRILQANPAMATILGYDSPADLVAQVNHVRDLYVDPARRDAFTTVLRDSGEVHDFDIQQYRRDGTPVWLSVSARLLDAEDGVPGEIEGFAVDITARKEAELELHTSRERFRLTFTHAPFGMAIVGLDGRFLEVNESLCDIVGYPVATLMQLGFQDITHPDDLDEDLAYVEQLLAGERNAYEMRKRYVHANGHVVPVRLVGSVVRDDDGTPLHFVAQIEDVGDRDRAEAAIRHREAILAAVSDLSETLLAGDRGWSETMNDELGRLASAAGADRAGVLQVFITEDGERAIRRPHAWATEGVDPLVDDPRLQALSYEAAGYGPWAVQLADGQSLNLRVADLDDVQRALLESFGSRTLLFAPIHVDGGWWGAISLERVLSDQVWSDIEVDALEAAARVVGAAVAHERVVHELEARDRRLTRLVRAVPLGITFADRDGTITLANRRAEEILRIERSAIAGRSYDDPDLADHRHGRWALPRRRAPLRSGGGGSSDRPGRAARHRASGRDAHGAVDHRRSAARCRRRLRGHGGDHRGHHRAAGRRAHTQPVRGDRRVVERRHPGQGPRRGRHGLEPGRGGALRLQRGRGDRSARVVPDPRGAPWRARRPARAGPRR